MTCPWLEETKEDSYCTAVSPKIKLNFEEAGPPDVNGEICKFPKPLFSPTVPWSKCKRYKHQ
jgi:hypothetical protein